MENKPYILVVEDDKPIRNFITAAISSQGYRYIETSKGNEAIALSMSNSPDLIILDLGLPDIDGIEVISRIREWSSVPIIIVSARENERQKVEALDKGADDYLTKPFGIGELLARIRVSLRHTMLNKNKEEIIDTFRVKNLFIDFEKRHVIIENKEIHLTPIEYKIISLLCKYSGRVLTHNFIIHEIWGTSLGNETQSLRVFMANLRRKIEKDPAQPEYIYTEVGVGYRLVDE
ncbi:KDP operon transcriptional regulatory protein KdpE [Clostridium pasteurianum DSM 525 = ATCC 6013]|uniref:Stage 0 sporulation protein A homolog n=1 Tax=Clostridium pasteurianum DSM 525 = ATCC 6013 TaxID=1262449 RepID=A0A0H3JB87_CLOPA|nr:response regulator [Clostridium pasteurianum]AJA49300.1 KDP operon transcriptional regulatory protein KdpE [Clostridium pasteurianum DSM 525 = ATCC 6013]AJA53288.1 KDP operon transcriptional regulatory protein KdpE [Clostridium pasteurianum DSM 525 = ATCC 6013]AOZ76478.1 XRE family transcriptional regulator [Clostridium pasteurianum DSM 525 = ATCC 6013]AOZ80275.1 XRE family transcriptional regulator [Clostridium pasteurianum]ELP58320.1 KDP operon transcriptional regulatory protein KdpE [Clo